MYKKIITGLLLAVSIFACACTPQIETEPNIDGASTESEPPANTNIANTANSATSTDETSEQAKLFDMVKGTWLCETECAYISVDLSDDSDPQWDYNITIQFDNSVHSSDYRIDDFAIFESGVPHYAYPPEEGILENETAVYFHSRDGEFDIGGLLVVDNERQYMKFALENGIWYTFYPYERDASVHLYMYHKSLATYIKTEAGIETLTEEALQQTAILLCDSGICYFYSIEAIPIDDYYMIKGHCLNITYDYPNQERDIIFYIDAEGNPVRESDWQDKLHQ